MATPALNQALWDLRRRWLRGMPLTQEEHDLLASQWPQTVDLPQRAFHARGAK